MKKNTHKNLEKKHEDVLCVKLSYVHIRSYDCLHNKVATEIREGTHSASSGTQVHELKKKRSRHCAQVFIGKSKKKGNGTRFHPSSYGIFSIISSS